MGCCLALNVELWAILHGLQLAKLRGYSKVVIKSDCMVAINLINEQMEGVTMTTLVPKIEEAARHFEMVQFLFTRREAKIVADWIAKLCAHSDINIHIIDVPNFSVRSLLLKDSCSMNRG